MTRPRSIPDGEINTLCQSCRRTCKQPIVVLIASCPRYYAGMKPQKKKWQQLPLFQEQPEGGGLRSKSQSSPKQK